MIEKFVLNETSYFGQGSRKELSTEILKRGYKKVLVVSDKVLEEVGVLKLVLDVLDEAYIQYEVYTDVKPNPTIKNVLDGVKVCKEANADVIVACGGGSSIDTAKAIGILMTNPNREVTSLNGLSNTINKSLPVIALPTTHGTAAEVTINYVITDEESKIKMVCVDPNDIPVLAIIDSDLMKSMPKSTAAFTGMDALTHAVEGYITKGHNTISDMFHLEAIKLIFENLEKAVNEKDDEAIEMMGKAQYIAGMGFSNVGLGIVHSMAHQLGAVYDTPHGMANTLLLPTVMEYNGEVCYERFRNILSYLGDKNSEAYSKEECISAFVEKIKTLSTKLGITQTVKDTGCKLEDLDMLAEKAMKDPCMPGNPREVTKEIFVELYKKAM